MSYHTKITRLCFQFGKDIDKGIINSFKECPITLSHLRDLREDCYKYKPDVYFIRDSDKRYMKFKRRTQKELEVAREVISERIESDNRMSKRGLQGLPAEVGNGVVNKFRK